MGSASVRQPRGPTALRHQSRRSQVGRQATVRSTPSAAARWLGLCGRQFCSN